jgi:hypothetical protein
MLLTGKYFVAWIEHGWKAVELGHHAVQAKLNPSFNTGNAGSAQPDNAETVEGFPGPTGAGSRLGSGPQGIDHHRREERLFAGRLVCYRLDEACAHRPATTWQIPDALTVGPLASRSAGARSVSQSG